MSLSQWLESTAEDSRPFLIATDPARSCPYAWRYQASLRVFDWRMFVHAAGWTDPPAAACWNSSALPSSGFEGGPEGCCTTQHAMISTISTSYAPHEDNFHPFSFSMHVCEITRSDTLGVECKRPKRLCPFSHALANGTTADAQSRSCMSATPHP